MILYCIIPIFIFFANFYKNPRIRSKESRDSVLTITYTNVDNKEYIILGDVIYSNKFIGGM